MAGPEHRGGAPLLGMLLLLTACGGGAGPAPAEKPASKAATPTASMEQTDAVQSAEPVTMRAQPTSVAEPVTQAELAAAFPAVAGLAPGPQELVTAALNLEPGPCRPCFEDRPRSIARCALDAPTGCENIPELVDRAARLGAAGAWIGPVRAVVAYGDPWIEIPGSPGAAWPVAEPAVPVELWVDLTYGPWQEAAQHGAELVETVQPEAPDAVGVHVRHFPASEVRQRPPHAAAGVLARGVAAAELQGRALPLLLALAEAVPDGVPTEAQLVTAAGTVDGLDLAAWEQARGPDGPQVSAALQADSAGVLPLGLRSAPSWRIDGYVLNGHRSLTALLDVARNQLLEHQPEIPAPLLAPPSAAPGPEAPPDGSPE